MARVPKSEEEKKLARVAKERAAKTQREVDNLVRLLQDLRSMSIGAPTVLRNVGDVVSHGAAKSSVIKQVLDGGMIYLLDEVMTERGPGSQHHDYRREIYVPWHGVETYFTEDELRAMEPLSYRDEVKINFYNVAVSSLLHSYYRGIDMNPDYQRADVWTCKDKVALIHSMFNNVEIGKFTLIRLPFVPTGPRMEILDGKQRLRSLVDFFEGRFKYKGRFFRDMHPRDRGHFLSYAVLYAEADGLSHGQKCNYFLKLNTAGKPQDQAHLAKVRRMAQAEDGGLERLVETKKARA
jgi:hypothetical protein